MKRTTGGVRFTVKTGKGPVPVEVTQTPYAEVEEIVRFSGQDKGVLAECLLAGGAVPVSPTVVRNVHRDLSFAIPADVEGPVAFIGMTGESAVLAGGVHRDFLRSTGRDDALFFTATCRQDTAANPIPFEPLGKDRGTFFLHAPSPEVGEMAAAVKSLFVVVDTADRDLDVATVTAAAIRHMPQIERTVCVSVCDLGVSAESLAIVRVHAAELQPVGDTIRPVASSAPVVSSIRGAEGIVPLSFPGSLAPLVQSAKNGECILVVGVGDVAWDGFVIAHAMEREIMMRGVEVRFVVTSSREKPGSRRLKGIDPSGFEFVPDIDSEEFSQVIVACEAQAVPAIRAAWPDATVWSPQDTLAAAA